MRLSETGINLLESSRRQSLARERAVLARAMLGNCRLCAHECGVNRLAGETGLCHAGPKARFFSAQTEVSDELELIPAFSVALSGCDLRCAFCITGASSWNPRAGADFEPREMALRAQAALENGARSIFILGGEPSIHLPDVLDFIALLPGDAKLVWKTNAHGSDQSRGLLEGLIDVYLADFKFGNDICARRLAKVSDYAPIIKENLLWAAGHSKVIVRHLIMPGHIDCCWKPIAEWLDRNMPGVKVSLRSGFWPGWQASRHSELRNRVLCGEMSQAIELAKAFELNLIP